MISHMQDSAYFALPALNNSTLSRFARCPAAVNTEFDTTPSMNLGTALHCAALEGQTAFLERFYIMEKVDGRTKEGKAARAQAEIDSEGKTIITMDDFDKVCGMAGSINSHPTANEFLSACPQREMAITWEMEGVKCKAKADALGKYLIDIKTTQSADQFKFANKTIVDNRYHVQLAWYYDGLKANLRAVEGVFIIAVENTAPYTCNVFQLNDAMLEWGTACYLPLLRKYRDCLANNHFPSYQQAGVIECRPPAWVSL